MDNSPYAHLEQFWRQRRHLIALCERLLAVLAALESTALPGEVQYLLSLLPDALRVLVVGECNRGKSTVINALVGQRLLPVYPVRTTVLLTTVKWGEQPAATLHFHPSRDGPLKPPRAIPHTETEGHNMIELESERLHIHGITVDDLERVLPVHLSNPGFLQHMEGSEGEAGRYDLERWQRDWHIAQLMPGRHMLACYLKESDAAVGFTEYIEENDDGKPWLGVLTIHKAHQRQGLGTETFERLAEHFRQEYGWPLIYAGILEHNEAGLAFARHLGFQPIKNLSQRLSGGVQEFIIFEREL